MISVELATTATAAAHATRRPDRIVGSDQFRLALSTDFRPQPRLLTADNFAEPQCGRPPGSLSHGGVHDQLRVWDAIGGTSPRFPGGERSRVDRAHRSVNRGRRRSVRCWVGVACPHGKKTLAPGCQSLLKFRVDVPTHSRPRRSSPAVLPWHDTTTTLTPAGAHVSKEPQPSRAHSRSRSRPSASISTSCTSTRRSRRSCASTRPLPCTNGSARPGRSRPPPRRCRRCSSVRSKRPSLPSSSRGGRRPETPSWLT